MNPLLSIAHRGYSAPYPDNTRLAFEGAIETGADYIEVDVRLTVDSHVVCCHDADLNRLVGSPLEIAKTRFDHIQSIDLGKGKQIMAGLRHQGEHVGFITSARLKNLHRIGVEAVLLNDPSLIAKRGRKGNQ